MDDDKSLNDNGIDGVAWRPQKKTRGRPRKGTRFGDVKKPVVAEGVTDDDLDAPGRPLAVTGRPRGGRSGMVVGGTPAAARGLTEVEERFCEVFCANGGVGDKAAIAAGYKGKYPSEAARKMMNRPGVRARIREIQSETCARLGLTHQRIVEEAARVAFARIEHVLAWENGRVFLRSVDEIPDAERAAIAEIIETSQSSGETKIRVRMHDKLRALDVLARLVGAYAPERVDVSGLDVLRTMDEGVLAARIEELGGIILGGRRVSSISCSTTAAPLPPGAGTSEDETCTSETAKNVD